MQQPVDLRRDAIQSEEVGHRYDLGIAVRLEDVEGLGLGLVEVCLVVEPEWVPKEPRSVAVVSHDGMQVACLLDMARYGFAVCAHEVGGHGGRPAEPPRSV